MRKRVSVKPRPCSYKDLMTLYGMSRKTLMLWLRPFMEEIGPKDGWYLTKAQVEIVFEKLGAPDEFDEEED